MLLLQLSFFRGEKLDLHALPPELLLTELYRLYVLLFLSCNIGWQLADNLGCCFVSTPVLFSTGSRLCYLGLTALPVDYKAHRRKQNTPSSVPSKHVSSASAHASPGAKTLMKQHPYPRRMHGWRWNLLSQWKKPQPGKVQHGSSRCIEECTVSQHQLCRALVPKLLVVLFICISISLLYVTAALARQRATQGYRSYHGHQVRCLHTKQSQFPWAAYDMHCWSNILPRVCHCRDINIFFS